MLFVPSAVPLSPVVIFFRVTKVMGGLSEFSESDSLLLSMDWRRDDLLVFILALSVAPRSFSDDNWSPLSEMSFDLGVMTGFSEVRRSLPAILAI